MADWPVLVAGSGTSTLGPALLREGLAVSVTLLDLARPAMEAMAEVAPGTGPVCPRGERAPASYYLFLRGALLTHVRGLVLYSSSSLFLLPLRLLPAPAALPAGGQRAPYEVARRTDGLDVSVGDVAKLDFPDEAFGAIVDKVARRHTVQHKQESHGWLIRRENAF